LMQMWCRFAGASPATFFLASVTISLDQTR
jgi:hypothetical protein